MPAVVPTVALEAQFSGSAGAWTDITADVRQDAGPMRWRYGIFGTGPMDRVAGTGTLSFVLDNSEKHSSASRGLYAPGHANARTGFDLGIGTRIKITYSGSTFYKFRGSLDEIIPQGGQRGPRRTFCTAVDWMDEAARVNVERRPTQVDKTGDQIIATVVGGMTRKPAASSLDVGKDTFPFALDNAFDESFTARGIFQQVAQSELGFIYIAGDQTTGGVLTFDNRHARPQSGSAVYTLDDSMTSLTMRRARDNLYNNINITIHPRRFDTSASILYTMQAVPLVAAGACLTFKAPYLTSGSGRIRQRTGASNNSLIQPAATTDYLANTASDGSGGNRTSNFTATASFGTNSCRVTMANGGADDAYITFFQVRGQGLADLEPIIVSASDGNSLATYGDSTLNYDMPLQTSACIGQDAANYLANLWSTPQTRVETIRFFANESDTQMKAALFNDISSRVTLVETATGIDGDYYIQAAEMVYSDKNLLEVAWTVAPTDPYDYWLIGVSGFSEIGQTTRLGY
mgnify:CR=1 FL=1